ncbi:hypothetical protein [Ochrobactrum chromiisoli]|uniref:Uncharacterized protein n=1 Tax=Ochrobactrum chromiisoli TaxID=2993941 RepID=A0ABT3QJ97_9HYPH|nr:hypothetical protein [Ochrobactrum chromiisoli]MCX2695681.1 hypothetical protein [Ochrobactrum chromiisoli]
MWQAPKLCGALEDKACKQMREYFQQRNQSGKWPSRERLQNDVGVMLQCHSAWAGHSPLSALELRVVMLQCFGLFANR